MAEKSKITDEYFKNNDNPNLEDFLTFAFEKMLEAYIVRSLQETKKHYVIQQVRNHEYEMVMEDFEEMNQGYHEDEYSCYFEVMLASLTQKQKMCAELFYKEGYSEKKIAQIMGISPQAVCHMHKGILHKLRKEM